MNFTPEQKAKALEELNKLPVVNTNPRQKTDLLLDMIENGLLDKDQVIMACLKYMSEDEVADMARANDFFMDEADDE